MVLPPSLDILLIGFGLAGLVSILAWQARSLTPSGTLAATLVGGLIFVFGGWSWATLLLTFFISSSMLSKFSDSKKGKVMEKIAKGSRRDGGQVLANGGMGVFLVLIHAYFPEQSWPWLAFAGAIAAVTGDTWATEIGILSRRSPRLVTTWKQVEHGISGGVTLVGSLATLAASGLVALVMAMFVKETASWAGVTAVILAGLAGAFFDSLLGASMQAIYYDPIQDKYTEQHILGAKPVRGWSWMDNDMVNFISSVLGALAALGLWQLFIRWQPGTY